MKVVGCAQPLNCPDVLALRLHGKHQAGAHGVIVEDDRAGATDAMLAAHMRAGLAAVFADRIGKCLARLDPNAMVAPVDVERDGKFIGSFVIHRRGRMSLNFSMIRASSSLLLRTTSGNVSRRLKGLQASITTRALRGSVSL